MTMIQIVFLIFGLVQYGLSQPSPNQDNFGPGKLLLTRSFVLNQYENLLSLDPLDINTEAKVRTLYENINSRMPWGSDSTGMEKTMALFDPSPEVGGRRHLDWALDGSGERIKNSVNNMKGKTINPATIRRDNAIYWSNGRQGKLRYADNWRERFVNDKNDPTLLRKRGSTGSIPDLRQIATGQSFNKPQKAQGQTPSQAQANTQNSLYPSLAGYMSRSASLESLNGPFRPVNNQPGSRIDLSHGPGNQVPSAPPLRSWKSTGSLDLSHGPGNQVPSAPPLYPSMSQFFGPGSGYSQAQAVPGPNPQGPNPQFQQNQQGYNPQGSQGSSQHGTIQQSSSGQSSSGQRSYIQFDQNEGWSGPYDANAAARRQEIKSRDERYNLDWFRKRAGLDSDGKPIKPNKDKSDWLGKIFQPFRNKKYGGPGGSGKPGKPGGPSKKSNPVNKVNKDVIVDLNENNIRTQMKGPVPPGMAKRPLISVSYLSGSLIQNMEQNKARLYKYLDGQYRQGPQDLALLGFFDEMSQSYGKLAVDFGLASRSFTGVAIGSVIQGVLNPLIQIHHLFASKTHQDKLIEIQNIQAYVAENYKSWVESFESASRKCVGKQDTLYTKLAYRLDPTGINTNISTTFFWADTIKGKIQVQIHPSQITRPRLFFECFEGQPKIDELDRQEYLSQILPGIPIYEINSIEKISRLTRTVNIICGSEKILEVEFIFQAKAPRLIPSRIYGNKINTDSCITNPFGRFSVISPGCMYNPGRNLDETWSCKEMEKGLQDPDNSNQTIILMNNGLIFNNQGKHNLRYDMTQTSNLYKVCIKNPNDFCELKLNTKINQTIELEGLDQINLPGLRIECDVFSGELDAFEFENSYVIIDTHGEFMCDNTKFILSNSNSGHKNSYLSNKMNKFNINIDPVLFPRTDSKNKISGHESIDFSQRLNLDPRERFEMLNNEVPWRQSYKLQIHYGNTLFYSGKWVAPDNVLIYPEYFNFEQDPISETSQKCKMGNVIYDPRSDVITVSCLRHLNIVFKDQDSWTIDFNFQSPICDPNKKIRPMPQLKWCQKDPYDSKDNTINEHIDSKGILKDNHVNTILFVPGFKEYDYPDFPDIHDSEAEQWFQIWDNMIRDMTQGTQDFINLIKSLGQDLTIYLDSNDKMNELINKYQDYQTQNIFTTNFQTTIQELALTSYALEETTVQEIQNRFIHPKAQILNILIEMKDPKERFQ